MGAARISAEVHFTGEEVHRRTIERGIEKALKDASVLPERKTA
jgi:hypothetical protein